jgi:hypothetical protein
MESLQLFVFGAEKQFRRFRGRGKRRSKISRVKWSRSTGQVRCFDSMDQLNPIVSGGTAGGARCFFESLTSSVMLRRTGERERNRSAHKTFASLSRTQFSKRSHGSERVCIGKEWLPCQASANTRMTAFPFRSLFAGLADNSESLNPESSIWTVNRQLAMRKIWCRI